MYSLLKKNVKEKENINNDYYYDYIKVLIKTCKNYINKKFFCVCVSKIERINRFVKRNFVFVFVFVLEVPFAITT